MRIIGTIDHPQLKITVFKMNNRISVKFETGLSEQIFKFRESEHLKNFEDAQKLVDEVFIKKVEEEFSQLHKIKMNALQRFHPPLKMDFEEII